MTKERPCLLGETESACHVPGLADFIARLLERYPGLSRAAALRLAGLPPEGLDKTGYDKTEKCR